MSFLSKIKNMMVSDNKESNINILENTENMENFLNTIVVYNSKRKLMILISYTPNYFNDIIEFITACSRVNIKYATQQSVYTETVQNDNDDYSLKPLIKHKRYYLLISGEIDNYIALYKVIDLENLILKAITKEIYNCRAGVTFKELTDIDVIDNDFISNVHANYDEPLYITYDNLDENEDSVECDDVVKIKNNIPTCFTIFDLIYLINYYNKEADKDAPMSIRELIYMGRYIRDKYPNKRRPSIDILIKFFSETNLIEEPVTEDKIFKLIEPKYTQSDDDDMIGSVSDDQLDQIFREQYERFSAVYNPMMEFTSIDEELSSDEESENMRMDDISEDDNN